MNQSRSRLVDLAGLLSNVTALHTLFSIFAFRQTGRSDPAGLLIWCVCLSLTCGGLALFLRRPRTQRSVLLLALAALALQGAVVWLWGVRYPSLLSWLCLLAMWGFSYFRCYELLIRPTPAEQLMVSFETASLVLLAGVGAILWALRRGGSRTRSHPPVRRGRVVDRRSPRDTLAMLWSRLADRVRFQLTYLARRNTPAGVLVWLDRRLKRRRRGRRPGETCRAFLDRAAAELPGCAQELGELARCLDQLYFGGGAPAFSPARASELRRALRLASRPPERPARH